MTIEVQYFAALAEHAGKTCESLDISHNSITKLYAQLKKNYGFPYELSEIRVAINTSYTVVSQPLAENDTIVFITPVAGG